MCVCLYRHVIMHKQVMDVKEQGGVCGRVWRGKRRGDDITSQVKGQRFKKITTLELETVLLVLLAHRLLGTGN